MKKEQESGTGAALASVSLMFLWDLFQRRAERKTADLCRLKQLRAVECDYVSIGEKWNINFDYDSSDSTILPEDCYEGDVPILRLFRF